MSRLFGRQSLLEPLTCILFLLAPSAIYAEWVTQEPLNIPRYAYSFIAASPSGDLLAVAHNSNPVGMPAANIPALLIKNAADPNPNVIELCKVPFEAQRGYSGIACDATGHFYVSGDTGDSKTGFVRKFKPDGTPDNGFGRGGEVRPNRRCLGVEVFGDCLFVTVDWGQVQIYRAQTGEMTGELPAAPGSPYIRDIALDPMNMRMFGVAMGGVVVWEGGSCWEPWKYKYREITPMIGHLRAAEGISIDPARRCALITSDVGNQLVEVSLDGKTIKTPVTTADPATRLVDSVVSFDGTMMFISDINSRKIHVMRRSTASVEVASSVPVLPPSQSPSAGADLPPPPPPTTQAVARTAWSRSYQQVVESARRQGKPMIVYFRQGGNKVCETFERDVLLSQAFDQHAQKFTAVFEDVNVDRLLAYRFGVFRIPDLVVLDSRGEIAGRFTYNIAPAQLHAVLDRIR